MRSKTERDLARQLKNSGKSYRYIGNLLQISRYAARNLCRSLKINKCKTGPKETISRRHISLMKREISVLKDRGEKINSSKLKRNCNLNVSARTIRRCLSKKLLLKYQNIRKKIVLDQKKCEERIKTTRKWIEDGHDWYKTVFTDEKVFSLDGPDDFRTWRAKNEPSIRNKRVCGGGHLMVWLMSLPNGLLAHKVMKGTFNSNKYVQLLKDRMLGIIKLNMPEFVFQMDNSRVHTSKFATKFFNENHVKVLKWCPYSPDLNIVEDIWAMLSNIVYDGPQYRTYFDLEKAINGAVNFLNKTRRNDIINLYGSVIRRLTQLLLNGGKFVK